MKTGTMVDYEVHIEYPEMISIGSIVNFQGSRVEVKKIDLVVPHEKTILVRGTGKIIE